MASLGGWTLVQSDAVGFAVSTFFDIFSRISKGDFNHDEVLDAKWRLALGYVLGHQSGEQMLDNLIAVRSRYGSFDFFDRYPKDLGAVDTSKWASMMAPCLGHEVVTAVGPKEIAEKELDKYGIKYEVVDWKALHEGLLTSKELKAWKKSEAKKKADEEKKTAATAGTTGS